MPPAGRPYRGCPRSRHDDLSTVEQDGSGKPRPDLSCTRIGPSVPGTGLPGLDRRAWRTARAGFSTYRSMGLHPGRAASSEQRHSNPARSVEPMRHTRRTLQQPLTAARLRDLGDSKRLGSEDADELCGMARSQVGVALCRSGGVVAGSVRNYLKRLREDADRDQLQGRKRKVEARMTNRLKSVDAWRENCRRMPGFVSFVDSHNVYYVKLNITKDALLSDPPHQLPDVRSP